jgi:glycosyltransferase involved in cell wall biosynthesis
MQATQRSAYERAAACCVASDWAAEAVVADYGVPRSKVHVVGFGRNCEPRPVPREWQVPRFLFVGADWKRKNGDAVVRAFARLRGELGQGQLDLVGNHPRVGLEGVVEHGALRLDDEADTRRLEELFEQATCYVMPSRFEAFGMVYVEAGTAGVPSIGTMRGGAATAIGDGGLLVDPDDENALLEAMRQLANPDRAAELGERAREHSGPYTWRGVAERILDSASVR